MKIMFVNALIGGDYSTLDVSITLLASIVNERSKHKAYIADTTFYKRSWKKYLNRKIDEIKPDIIAFSCNTLYMNYVEKIATHIKKRFKLPVICGGYHVSIYPEKTITLPFVDAILLGDGDEKLIPILDYFEKNYKFPKNIKGLWIKDKGKIIETGKGDFYQNISNFPHLNWDLWENLDKYFYYLQMIYFVGNKGCPYTCSFCEACEIHENVEGKYFREIDPKRYAQELAYQWKKYEKKGMKLAQLFDPVPTMNKRWVKEFTEEYKKLVNPRTHPFSIFSRIDHINEEKLKMVSSAGCKIIRYGIESGDDEIRNKIHHKGVSTEKILKITSLTKKNKIAMTAFYILGAPGETRKTINKTGKLALKINASRTAFFIYKPITKKSMELVKNYHNILNSKKIMKNDNLQYGAVIELEDISTKQIEILQTKFYLKYLKKKISKMIKEEGISYFINFAIYLTKGLKDGLNIKYLTPYYHIYAYDHITK